MPLPDRSQGKLTTACLKPLLDGKAVHLRRLYLTDQSIGYEQVLKLIKERGKVLEVSCLWHLHSHHQPIVTASSQSTSSATCS